MWSRKNFRYFKFKIKLKNKPLGIDIINHKDKDKRINFKKINALNFFLKNKKNLI